jgi:hypothetical protein
MGLYCVIPFRFLARSFQKGRSKRGEDPSRPNGGDVLCRIVFGSFFCAPGQKFATCFSQPGADFAEHSLPVESIGDGAMVMRNQ